MTLKTTLERQHGPAGAGFTTGVFKNFIRTFLERKTHYARKNVRVNDINFC